MVLYEWLKDSGHALDDRLCTTVGGDMRGRVQGSHGSPLVECGSWLEGGSGQPAPLAHGHALKACSPACTPPALAQLIRLCADHGDAVGALNVYEWMRAPREAGGAALRATAFTYTAAMRAALGAGMLDRAMQVRGAAVRTHLRSMGGGG